MRPGFAVERITCAIDADAKRRKFLDRYAVAERFGDRDVIGFRLPAARAELGADGGDAFLNGRKFADAFIGEPERFLPLDEELGRIERAGENLGNEIIEPILKPRPLRHEDLNI